MPARPDRNAEILTALDAGVSRASVARDFGISPARVSQIANATRSAGILPRCVRCGAASARAIPRGAVTIVVCGRHLRHAERLVERERRLRGELDQVERQIIDFIHAC